MRLQHRSWRHLGLGFLQAEISPTLRMHVWHPTLRSPWYYANAFRPVHDHRYHLHSIILFGVLADVKWAVEPLGPESEANTSIWRRPQRRPSRRAPDLMVRESGLTEYECPAWAAPVSETVYQAGQAYDVPRRQFHATRTDVLTVTLVHRGPAFDEEPARVLGSRAEGGVISFVSASERKTWDVVLSAAELATKGIDL